MTKTYQKIFLLTLLLTNVLVLIVTTHADEPQIVIPDAGPDQYVYSGQVVSLNGTWFEPYPGAGEYYRWDFGDGSPIEEGPVPYPWPAVATLHIYVGSPGTSFTVTFSVWQNMVHGEWESDTAIITIINSPPVADANGPYSGDEGSTITLDASGSSDADNNIVLYEWDLDNDGEYDDAVGVTASYLCGSSKVYTVGLRVTDEGGLSDTDSTSVTVNNVPPTADAGPDQTVNEDTVVILDGDYSDPGNDVVLFEWDFEGDGVYDWSSASSPDTTHTYPIPGVYVAKLRVTDDDGATDTDTAVITVGDITPPEISVTVTPDTLWPPNHKYVTVTATVTVSDNFDASPTVNLVSVTSNEPDNGEGDGNTVNDIVIVDDYTFMLRAERSELGSGRIYTITYQAVDDSGNTAVAYATVTVPLEK